MQQNPATDRVATTPQIYVASLVDYNAGRRHGGWIDAAQGVQGILAAIQGMLRQSCEPFATEWAIHDSQGFGPIRIREHADLASVSLIARGVETHGLAFAAWIAYCGEITEETASRFCDAYRGTWRSIAHFAEHLAERLLPPATPVPGWFGRYVCVNTDLLAADLRRRLVTSPSEEGGVHVFDPEA